METSKNKITWTKISGAKNSFWITHFLSPVPSSLINRNWPQIAQTLCKRSQTDGLAILLPSNVCDFKWIFYNADGSLAEMCGNAACCVTDYVFKKNLIPAKQSSLTFETAAQQIKGELKEGKARIFLKHDENTIQGPFEAFINKGEKTTFLFINSSVPHAVVELPTWPSTSTEWENKKNIAKILREKTTHHKNGMNVSFYHHQSDTQLFARCFERGIEDFTPACGTGALAVAQIYRQYRPHLHLIFVQMPGGQLEIGFHSDKTVSLISPVKWLQEIEER